jgi:hypothetical protein
MFVANLLPALAKASNTVVFWHLLQARLGTLTQGLVMQLYLHRQTPGMKPQTSRLLHNSIPLDSC